MSEKFRNILRPFFGELQTPEFKPNSKEDWILQGLELRTLILKYDENQPLESQPTLLRLHSFLDTFHQLPSNPLKIHKRLKNLGFISKPLGLDLMSDSSYQVNIATLPFWHFNLQFNFPSNSTILLDHLKTLRPKTLFLKHLSDSNTHVMELNRFKDFWQIGNFLVTPKRSR